MNRHDATAICDRVIGKRGFAFSIDVDASGRRAVAAVGGEDPGSPELWLVDLEAGDGTRVETLSDWPLAAVYFAEQHDSDTLGVVLVSRYENPPDRHVIRVDARILTVTGYADASEPKDYDVRKLAEVRPRDGFIDPEW